MKLFAFAIATIHGLLAVGLLAIVETIVQAFAPDWTLPFSFWWGLLLCLPGIAFAMAVPRSRF